MNQSYFPSPKRKKESRAGWEGFFPYYAGFPESFVRAVFEKLEPTNSTMVLDPWNGSGTTTYSAAVAGYSSIGCDLNPVMVVIAKARLLSPSEADSIVPLGREIAREALANLNEIDSSDPLTRFFSYKTASLIRALEISIRRHLVGQLTLASDGLHLENITSLAASYYSALFSVCRELTKKFRSSNPTWLRFPKSGEAKVSRKVENIIRKFEARLHGMAETLKTLQPNARNENTHTSIRLWDTSTSSLPLNSVDLVVTSPPYCTRIDYTAATRVELCVLAPMLMATAREIGSKMLGSVQVPKTAADQSVSWGKTCNSFLGSVKAHPSKASSGYYYKIHSDYFDKLGKSLDNLAPTLRKGASAIVVVQDSFYKDVHNDLPRMLVEMAEFRGLGLKSKQDFYFRQSMSGVNPKARAYDRRQGAVESVLWLQKD